MGAKEQYSPASLSLLSKDSRRAIKAGGGHTAQSIHAFATKEKYNNIALLQRRSAFFGVSKELRRHQLRGKNTFAAATRARARARFLPLLTARRSKETRY
jgi:hypothetical protein